MRILLSSVGRRGYLVKYFKEALGNNGEVWGADSSQYAPAFHYCDKSALLPEVTSRNYVDELLAFCRSNKINMLVPLIDPELPVLAAQRQRFFDAGIIAVISPPETIETSSDKYLTYKFGKEKHIDVPETVLSLSEAEALLANGRLGWPVVVKPRDGSASVNITYCKDKRQLRNAFENCPNPMIQEYMEGDEFGYDLFSDRDFKPISVFCKLKLAMRAGETDKAVSTDNKELIALGLKIAENLQLFGPADLDVKIGKDGPKLLEINPRFGGGYPCSHLGGANFPTKLLSLCNGERLSPDIGSCPAGVYMFKQDEIVTVSRKKLESIPGSGQKI
jgi:carbamoyl-phosphate synthase large subunit